jgi:rod shape-determining protein MreC
MSKKYLSSKLIKLVLIVAACGLLIFLNPRKIFSPFRNFLLTIAYPFEKIIYLASQKTGNTIEFLGSISRLRSENEKLLKENQFLTSQRAALNQEKKENDSLREQLGLLPRKKFELEAGSVIGQDPQKLGSWIIIDKGQSSGIAEGMPVIVSEGIIVGKVSETYLNSAKINFLTDSASSINAMDTDTNSKGIIKGEFGLGIMMDMVAQTDILNVGDDIATSGLGGGIPRGLLIGKIQEIRMTQDKLFQQAVIIPSAKYAKLDTVFVIKNNK